MTHFTADVHNPKSLAEVVLDAKIPRWRKWLLRKLMPAELWDAPALTIAKLQKGAIIGKLKMEVF